MNLYIHLCRAKGYIAKGKIDMVNIWRLPYDLSIVLALEHWRYFKLELINIMLDSLIIYIFNAVKIIETNWYDFFV